jgi:hypothetical protein
MLVDLPQYLRRDLKRLHGDMHNPVVWPLEMHAMLVAIEAIVQHGKAAVLESYQWRTCSGFGAKATIAAVASRLLVDGFYQRRGDLLIFRPRAS